MPERVCLDAGVVARLFLPEEGRDRAERLVEGLMKAEADIVVPAFFGAEVLSVLRNKVLGRVLTPAEGETAATWVVVFLGQVRQLSDPRHYERAWSLAVSLDWPTIDDTVYLAVAEMEGADFWTADRSLYERSQAVTRNWVTRVKLL